MLLPPCRGTMVCAPSSSLCEPQTCSYQPSQRPEQNGGLPRSPHAGPTVSQPIWPKTSSAWGRGAGPAPWKDEERGHQCRHHSSRHSEASQTISTTTSWRRWGDRSPEQGSSRPGSWSRSEVELTPRPQSWAAALTPDRKESTEWPGGGAQGQGQRWR